MTYSPPCCPPPMTTNSMCWHASSVTFSVTWTHRRMMSTHVKLLVVRVYAASSHCEKRSLIYRLMLCPAMQSWTHPVSQVWLPL